MNPYQTAALAVSILALAVALYVWRRSKRLATQMAGDATANMARLTEQLKDAIHLTLMKYRDAAQGAAPEDEKRYCNAAKQRMSELIDIYAKAGPFS